MFSNRCSYIVVFLGLTACGGGESVPSEVTSPEAVQSLTQVDLTGQAGSVLLVAKKVHGVQSQDRATVSSSFSNATGTLRHASSSSIVQGNLTLGVSASDSDIMKKVSLYLPNVGRTFILCSSDCTPELQLTISGFNPQLANEVAGPLRIELIVEDNLGHSAVVDALSVNWQPIQISAINASRENGKVFVSWSGNAGLERYNLYASTELGLTTSNAFELEHGVQQLAIKGTSVEFTDEEPSQDYYLLITGIDSGGESGKSTPYIIPRVIGAINPPPVANNDSYQLNEDEALMVNVLENDFDPHGQLIKIDVVLLQPVNGSLEVDDVGYFIYKPYLNFNGRDSVSYRIVDSQGATAEAIVFFDVLAVNDNPIALNDIYGVNANGKVLLAGSDLLSNDSDVDGDELQVVTTPITYPQQGTVLINADGSFSYQSIGVLLENDHFIYQVVDGSGGSANATVTITTKGGTLPPLARKDSYKIDEDNTLVINTVDLGILANDSDRNDLPFVLLENLLLQPQHGQLNLSLDGTFIYIPNSNFTGVDQFQYQIKNTNEILAQAFVKITVKPMPDIPIALDDNYQTVENVSLFVSASTGLLANDADFDNSKLRVDTTPLNPPRKGTLSLDKDGSFSYQPHADFNGVDSFTYQIKNKGEFSNAANVNIVILPTTDAPIVIDDNITSN